MAITLVQSVGGTNQFGGNPYSQAFGSNTTPGSLLVAATIIEKTSAPAVTISSVTDTQGNAYTVLALNSISSPDSIQIACVIAYAWNTLGGANTVTFTLSTGPNANNMALWEFSGVKTTGNPLDQQSSTNGVSINPTAGPVTTTANGEACIATCLSDDGAGAAAPTAGSGWTLIGGIFGGAWAGSSESIIQTTAGSISGNFVHATGTWVAQMATFFPPSPPASNPPSAIAIGCDYQWGGGDD